MKQKERDTLTGRNGCLTFHGIMLYAKKKATPVQREHIEAHLRHCALCREAVRGYGAHVSGEDLPHELDRLTLKIRERYLGYRRRPEKKRLIFTGFLFTMVLVLVLLLYLLYRYLQVMP